MYDQADADRLEFWAEQARALLHWDTEFTETLDWSQAPVARWFADGTLNAAYNAVDRHVEAGRGEQPAVIYDSAVLDRQEVITYAELQQRVARAAGALRDS